MRVRFSTRLLVSLAVGTMLLPPAAGCGTKKKPALTVDLGRERAGAAITPMPFIKTTR